MKKYKFYIFFIIIQTLMLSCIHEHPDKNPVDPSAIQFGVELTLDLNWGENEEAPFYFTRSGKEIEMRVIIEISRNGETIGRDISYLNKEDLAAGTFRTKLPFTLSASTYEIAVWSDCSPYSNGFESYDVSSLTEIKPKTQSLKWELSQNCGYASDYLDLRKYKGQTDVKILKALTLKHAGARFKLITTDIRKFVEKELNAIENGDTYSISLTFGTDTPESFNAYSGSANRNYQEINISESFTPSYSLYGEQEIAEGFIFCNDNDEASMRITVYNSARMIVARSPEFTFKIKRGVLTYVYGDFLSDAFSNTITVNHIWDGEIIVEI